MAAWEARARLVRFDGETVYCAKHLFELDIVQQDGDSYTFASQLAGAHKVRLADAETRPSSPART